MNMRNENYHDRFKDAPWYTRSKHESIAILGLGGIGSNTFYNMFKTIPANYLLIDFDRVEEHNIGTQFFLREHVGAFKVAAMSSFASSIDELHWKRVHLGTVKITNTIQTDLYKPITITGFDNMDARKNAFKAWKSLEDKELFIDGRLRASLYEIYCVTPGERVAMYEQTLFDDDEVETEPCTFKQTAYFGMLIGARITQMVVNFLTNKYSEDPVCVVPFKIKELGEPCHVEII
jgi:molybdopterin/thiamine biosynthesis adenylyltransferase